MFIQNKTYVNLLLFLECIYKVTMTCFTTRHIQEGVRATFFNSEGAKINDSLGPPGVRPPGYAPEWVQEHTNFSRFTPSFYFPFRYSSLGGALVVSRRFRGAGKARFNVATPTNATVTCTAYVLPYNLQTKSI